MPEQVERSYEVSIDLATGLYDRRTMWSRLAEEVSRSRRYHYPLSLMLITFDAPETQRAVECILQLAEILKRHTRLADILVRYSEDALAILLPCTDERGALYLAERIRRLAQLMPSPANRAGESIAISIGVTSTTGDASVDKIALVEQVEWALRKAQKKHDGSHTVVVPAPRQAPSSEEAP